MAKKVASRKRSAKKSAARKPATKRPATRKPAAKKAAAKKPAARKAAARKPATRRPARVTTELATRFIKREAAKQPIRVELTEEQAGAILRAWNDLNPKRAARVTFVVQGRELSDFAVAAYRYSGDTCCV